MIRAQCAGAMKKPVLLGAVLLLAALSASDADEEHCTDSESCSEPAESIWSWLPQSWDIFSILEKIEKTIMYNINKKAQELYEDFARSMQSWEIFSTIQKILTNVKDTIAHNAKVVYEKLEDFADRVRNVFREEFGSFLEVLWERALGIAPESGKYRHLSNCIHTCIHTTFKYRTPTIIGHIY